MTPASQISNSKLRNCFVTILCEPENSLNNSVSYPFLYGLDGSGFSCDSNNNLLCNNQNRNVNINQFDTWLTSPQSDTTLPLLFGGQCKISEPQCPSELSQKILADVSCIKYSPRCQGDLISRPNLNGFTSDVCTRKWFSIGCNQTSTFYQNIWNQTNPSLLSINSTSTSSTGLFNITRIFTGNVSISDPNTQNLYQVDFIHAACYGLYSIATNPLPANTINGLWCVGGDQPSTVGGVFVNETSLSANQCVVSQYDCNMLNGLLFSSVTMNPPVGFNFTSVCPVKEVTCQSVNNIDCSVWEFGCNVNIPVASTLSTFPTQCVMDVQVDKSCNNPTLCSSTYPPSPVLTPACVCPLDQLGEYCTIKRLIDCGSEIFSHSCPKPYNLTTLSSACLNLMSNQPLEIGYKLNCSWYFEHPITARQIAANFSYDISTPNVSVTNFTEFDPHLEFHFWNFNRLADTTGVYVLPLTKSQVMGLEALWFNLSLSKIPQNFWFGNRLYYEVYWNYHTRTNVADARFIDTNDADFIANLTKSRYPATASTPIVAIVLPVVFGVLAIVSIVVVVVYRKRTK
jgi:hypothetical protein